MSWLFLIIAGGFEVLGVWILKRLSNSKAMGFVVWYFFLWVGFGLSLFFLYLSMSQIEMSVAYAVWTGIGAVGGALLGIFAFHEGVSFKKVFFISLIVACVIGLKLA